METNKYVKSLEEAIADANYKINELKHGNTKHKHPEILIKSLNRRVKSLSEIMEIFRKFSELGSK